MKLKNRRVIKRLKNIIESQTYLQKDKKGYYYGDIYADYCDTFDSETIRKIFSSKDPRDKFYEIINDIYFDSDIEYYDEIIKTVKNSFEGEYDELECFIRDWINENVYFNYPYRHYLQEEIYINIIVDTGDGNYDYTQNELFGCVYSEKGIVGRRESSLLWLMQQQGYTMDQIVAFIDSGDAQGNKFLESIRIECKNTTTHMNALSFFVKMSLEDCFNLNEALQKEEMDNKKITLKRKTPCGLYDPWNGAGSVLGINLEKDVKLPLKYIDSILPDGCRGYSVNDIYGMCGSFWGKNCIELAI